MTQPLPDRAYMTPLLNRIADAIGDEAAIKLATAKPGELIYIPTSATPDHWIAQLVGMDAATALSEAFGTKHVEIPAALAGEKRRRAAMLADLIDKGYSINTIVRMTGLSRSTIKTHLKRRPADTRQGSLF